MTDHSVQTGQTRIDRSRSMGLKLILVGALVVLLGAPLALVNLLAWERANRAETVSAEVGAAYGGAQEMRGPFLVLPYTIDREMEVRDANGRTRREMRTVTETIVLSPDTLHLTGALETRILHRAIYDVPVYEAGLQMSGRFDTGAAGDVLPEGGTIDWTGARMIYAVSDLRGIGEDFRFTLSGRRALRFEPQSDFDRLGPDGAAWRGMAAPVANLRPGEAFDFEGALQISGAGRFALLASGRETTADVTSDWPHPGFDGQYLPDTREIGSDGFTASWRVPYLARGVPAAWVEGRGYTLNQASTALFAVNLVTPADGYAQVSRSLKYALLFLAFTLLMFFLIEANGERPVHAAQYVLIGLAQVVFYLLLLAMSEHLGVWAAYGVAALATITLTAGYALTIFRSQPRAMVTFAGLTLTYLVQFVLVLVEDYALLIGSGLVFAALAATMFMTRKVDWYGMTAGVEGRASPAN
ncbi:MAG: cell envelope integrity protein CreD [Alphaproteobacteria bacterium]|nr:cell envelope integrity protein CreD [Alphaproteobacteria bacterium]